MNNEDLEDKVMAMEFAFMCLAKALHERELVPLSALSHHLDKAVGQMRESGGLEPVAEHLDALRDTLLQLQ